jgi:hypothetical protein
MKAVSKKKIKAIGILFGVKITVDKTLDKYAKISSEKVAESNQLLANSTFNF